MRKLKPGPVRPSHTLAPHEVLDAYWAAEMLRVRALRVATEARCKTTIGRRLESALGRAIRFIVEAADEAPEKADARLRRARAAIGLGLAYFNELAIARGVREVVILDLRERAARLLQRLEMLEGEEVETWAASNYLPTVLDEAGNGANHGSTRNVVAPLEKVRGAAVRHLPRPVVAEDPPARAVGVRSELLAVTEDEPATG